jgi:hypothetical protein
MITIRTLVAHTLPTQKLGTNGIRTLQDNELDAVTGGVMEGGCIQYPTILKTILPASDWTFKDVFARPTIG